MPSHSFPAGSRTWTGTRLPPSDFESDASAIPPCRREILRIERILVYHMSAGFASTFCDSPGLFHELFMSRSNLCNLVILSLTSFLVNRSRKKRKLPLYPFTRLFFRGILYIESIQTGYALKHILFPQSGIVTKAVHHFCHDVCHACFVHCQT